MSASVNSTSTNSISRRTALALISGGAPACLGAGAVSAATFMKNKPALATPAQIDAEKRLLSLLKDPELIALQAKLKAGLAATPRAQMPDAAARLDDAVAQWTNSLILKEYCVADPTNAFIWGTDDTSRTWMGYTIGGVGTSGDNPDAVYRTACIDGAGRYEILGKFDMANRPAQLTMEANNADPTQSAALLNPKKLDVVSAAMTTDRDIKIAADGSFRITINGGAAKGPNHFEVPAGIITIGVRDILSNWKQRACSLKIRRLDKAKSKTFNHAEFHRRVLSDLPDYINFWSKFPDIWMGGLKPNTIAEVKQRPGGWGFNTGLRFQLSKDNALLVTMRPGEAKYTGFQIIDPWMIAPDARRNQVSLNNSQSAPNPDGSVTYIISLSDPGVANWLDTAGIHDGLAILRWQNVPPDMKADGVVADFRVIPLSDVAKIGTLPRVTPEERRVRLAARVEDYNTRVL